MDFFGVNKKISWKKVPMGKQESVPVFAAMMDIIQDEWQEDADS